MINRAVLLGRLVRDPDLRYTSSGIAVVSFTLAVDRKKNKDGEKEVDFIPVVAWRQLAELCANYLKKGQQAAVDGRIQVRKYDNTEGRKVYVTEIVADNVQFLSGGQSQGKSEQKQDFKDPFSSGQPIDIDSDDLPF